MFGKGNCKAEPEYVNSKTTVLWDMKTCPVPDGYDARRVRPSIESALKDLGYYGPVTITAMGNLEKTAPHVLQGISSTGIVVQHTTFNMVPGFIFDDLVKFKSDNPPPATIMLISEDVKERLSFSLCLNQQSHTGYNLVVVCRSRPGENLYLYHTAELLWETLLAAEANKQETRGYILQKCSESGDSASILCRSCNYPVLSITDFTNHLSTEEHKHKEINLKKISMLHAVLQAAKVYKVKKNQAAAPEYVNSKTAVWWDMDTCSVPDGYDAHRVRPSIEWALKDLGYCGPVLITAMGNLEKTPPHVLQGLSSTGIALQHTYSDKVSFSIFDPLLLFKSRNPPPATIMLISDQIESSTLFLPHHQQKRIGYNIVLARTCTPKRVSHLYHTAEWLWQTLLADSLSEANEQETRRNVSQSGDLASILCRSCDCTCLSVTDFTSHLSTEKHKQSEMAIINSRIPDSAKDISDPEEDMSDSDMSDSEEDKQSMAEASFSF